MIRVVTIAAAAIAVAVVAAVWLINWAFCEMADIDAANGDLWS